MKTTPIWLAACAAFLVAAPALAAPHAAYKPVSVDGIPTYKRTHKVGPIVFTHDFVEASAKAAKAPLQKLSFAQGQPPAEWWGRSYYPATLAEAVKSIPYASRGHRVSTLVYLDGKLIHNSRMDLEKEHHGPTWNTTSWEGADIKSELSDLPPGPHKLVVWRQLDYEVKAMDKVTKKVFLEQAYMSLAKGSLELDVTE